MFYVLFVIYLFMTSCGLLLLKMGGQTTHVAVTKSILDMQLDGKFIVGMLCYICSFLLFTVIMQKRNLSFIYPLSAGIVNVVSVLMGVLILKEKMTVTGVIGIAAIVFGTVLLNIRS